MRASIYCAYGYYGEIKASEFGLATREPWSPRYGPRFLFTARGEGSLAQNGVYVVLVGEVAGNEDLLDL